MNNDLYEFYYWLVDQGLAKQGMNVTRLVQLFEEKKK